MKNKKCIKAHDMFFTKRGWYSLNTMDRKPIFPWAYVKAHYLIYGQEYIFSYYHTSKVSFEWKYRSSYIWIGGEKFSCKYFIINAHSVIWIKIHLLTCISFLSLNLFIPDYSTQLLSAPNDGPGGGGGTGIYLDHNQYSSKSSSRGGNIIGKDFGTNAVKHVPPGKKLDFSSPSLYTNSSGRMGSDGFLHIILAVAISAVTSILFSYSQLFSSTYKSPWSCYKTSKDKKFMQNRINVDTRSMKHEPDNNHNVEHNIQYLKRYVACNRNSDGGDSRRNSSKLNKKKESMACVLCIWMVRMRKD